jgi:hypothetical protein
MEPLPACQYQLPFTKNVCDNEHARNEQRQQRDLEADQSPEIGCGHTYHERITEGKDKTHLQERIRPQQ